MPTNHLSNRADFLNLTAICTPCDRLTQPIPNSDESNSWWWSKEFTVTPIILFGDAKLCLVVIWVN